MAARPRTVDVFGATLSRRQFVKTGGVMIVGMAALGPELLRSTVHAQGTATKNTLDPALASSWFEIHADNTMVLRTGKCDFGQSTVTTAYKQIVAEELNFPFESITSVVMGDTDRTPDAGVSAAFLQMGGANLRKAAAYTREALLDLAATKLGVARGDLKVSDGVVSGGGKRITYGELVAGQQLTLKIPVTGSLTSMFGLSVTGNPPLKPVSEYTVIGKPYKNFVTESKVRAKETWITDVRLPGMLHARIVRPKTLGSELVAAGDVDKKQFPTSQVIVKGNLVAVVAATEWEAVRAAQQVATVTKWTDWKGLPGTANLQKALREADWKIVPADTGKNRGSVAPALAKASKKLTASYELPFVKHAPIGPTIAVADAKSDGTVYLYVHNQNPSALRGHIATMLGTSLDKIVVRTFAGPGHYGRSNGGNSGAEDEAVLLSQAVGKPVRVQWMRPEDLMWSTNSAASYSDVQIALDAEGKILGAQLDHYMPAMQDDRPIGAILAGLPTMTAPDVNVPPGFPVNSINNRISDAWLYDGVPNLGEFAHGTYQLGQKASPLNVGIRNHSMRTPGQLQQNFPRELAMSEAAALAGVDPLEFRLRHTTDQRLIGVIEAVRKATGWQARPAPHPRAASTGSTPVTGQGVSVIIRDNTYWACVCQVTVIPATGKVTVDKYTVAVDPGIVINPLQLKRQVQGGAIMGVSLALYEEVQFDEGSLTSRDWRSYPIATIADTPEVQVIIVERPDVGKYGGVSEAANALAVAAIAGAFLDATGKAPRRLPLRPAYVQALMKA